MSNMTSNILNEGVIKVLIYAVFTAPVLKKRTNDGLLRKIEENTVKRCF